MAGLIQDRADDLMALRQVALELSDGRVERRPVFCRIARACSSDARARARSPDS